MPHLSCVLLDHLVQLQVVHHDLDVPGEELCCLVFQSWQIEQPGGLEDVHDSVSVDQHCQQFATDLLKAGEEEHVGGVEELGYDVLGDVTRIGVDEMYNSTKYCDKKN